MSRSLELLRRRLSEPIFVFVFLFSALGLAGCSSGPYEDVHEADRMLSHPRDPDRMANGVPMKDIVPRRALEVVRKAIENYPETPRFYYQLGRAHSAAGDSQQAIDAFKEAAQRGYRMAYYNLGTVYGAGDLVQRDPDKAKKFLQKAIDAGVELAETNLRVYVFDASGFSDPDLFRGIYTRSVDDMDYQPTEIAAYLQTFLEPFFNTKDCPWPVSKAAYSRVAAHARSKVFGEYLNAMKSAQRSGSSGLQEGRQMRRELDRISGNGRQDAELFAQRYGCRGVVAQEFFSRLETVISRIPSP